MKALIISDLHGSIRFLSQLEELITKYELILCTGDLTNFGQPEGYVNALEKVVRGKEFLWASGNNDIGQSYQYTSRVLKNIDGQVATYQGFKFSGFGGTTANFEGQNFGPSLIKKPEDIAGTILLSHIPPSKKLHYSSQDIKCQETRINLRDVPRAHLCGHLHGLPGVACIGGTKIVKMGAAKDGYWAEIDLGDLDVSFVSQQSQ